jgi:hypothetical protein
MINFHELEMIHGWYVLIFYLFIYYYYYFGCGECNICILNVFEQMQTLNNYE